MSAGVPVGGDRLPAGWSRLLERLQTAPEPERITAAAQPGASPRTPRARADELVQSQGFSALGDRWIEIDAETARQTVVRVLACHLDDERPIMARSKAEPLASAFIELATPATYLTNGSWCAAAAPLSADARVGPFWTPISPRIFDGGVVALSAAFTAVVWVCEED